MAIAVLIVKNLVFFFRCKCGKEKCANEALQIGASNFGSPMKRPRPHSGKISTETSSDFMTRNEINQRQSRWSLEETLVLAEVSGFARKTIRNGEVYLAYNSMQKSGRFEIRPKKKKQIDCKLKDLRDKEFLYSPLRPVPLVAKSIKKSK